MIKRLKYEEVDWQKYQNCLEQSEQYIFFAEKKYLDLLLHQNWEILVDNDYEAVMPIPLAKKWGFTFVVMPLQTQQLGVFSKKDNPELNELFLSGKIQSKAIQIRDFQYNDMVRHLEHLSQENLVSYAFNQTIMNGVGTFKGGQIVLTPHYLQDVLSLLR